MIIQPITAVLICLISAYVFAEFFRLLGLPRVVGQISAGLFLGITFKFVTLSQPSIDTLTFLSDLGIILLFYYVGLETNFKAFSRNIKRSILISLFNTTIPFLTGFLVMRYLFYFEMLPSIIIGVSLSVSAQSVSIDILEEMKKLKSKLGNLVISIGAVDDIIELILVTSLLSIFHFSISNLTLSRLLIDLLIFLFIVVASRLWFIPHTLKYFDKEKSSTARFMGSMIIVLLIASLSEFLGFGLLIGAMIAGMIVRQTIFKEVNIPNWEEHDIAKSTHIIAFGFLIPLFFIWVGFNTDLTLIQGNFHLILAFILIAVLGTVGGTIIGTLLGKGSFKEGHMLGWGLNPKGDVELVIATIALKASIISPQIFTAIVIMSLFTTIISPIIFKQLAAKY
ncbi:cation:proton antiporter [Candidatus Woesearchaeota archaeon]|nr:cation:proton antiporter [Candidatus Woesearchaeota archaeon]